MKRGEGQFWCISCECEYSTSVVFGLGVYMYSIVWHIYPFNYGTAAGSFLAPMPWSFLCTDTVSALKSTVYNDSRMKCIYYTRDVATSGRTEL